MYCAAFVWARGKLFSKEKINQALCIRYIIIIRYFADQWLDHCFLDYCQGDISKVCRVNISTTALKMELLTACACQNSHSLVVTSLFVVIFFEYRKFHIVSAMIFIS